MNDFAYSTDCFRVRFSTVSLLQADRIEPIQLHRLPLGYLSLVSVLFACQVFGLKLTVLSLFPIAFPIGTGQTYEFLSFQANTVDGMAS